jgi:two-component system chemotaxis response regulator CheB
MWLRHVLELDETIRVVAEAPDAQQAEIEISRHQPDVVTLDVDMPGKSGLAFLAEIMDRAPIPVVMISGLTHRGSAAAIEALTLGAVDCLVKPTSAPTAQDERHIQRRVRVAATARLVQRKTPRQTRPKPSEHQRISLRDPVLLGASTGGVSALECVLNDLDEIDAPVVIAQHMPERFLQSFAVRLNKRLQRRVVVSEANLELHPDMIVLASGLGLSTVLKFKGGKWFCDLQPPSTLSLYHPSVDDLFQSAAQQFSAKPLGAALLTGMGRDGACGMVDLRNSGCFTVAQNEATSTVFGMPKAAIEMGGASAVLPISEIGPSLRKCITVERSQHPSNFASYNG